MARLTAPRADVARRRTGPATAIDASAPRRPTAPRRRAAPPRRRADPRAAASGSRRRRASRTRSGRRAPHAGGRAVLAQRQALVDGVARRTPRCATSAAAATVARGRGRPDARSSSSPRRRPRGGPASARSSSTGSGSRWRSSPSGAPRSASGRPAAGRPAGAGGPLEVRAVIPGKVVGGVGGAGRPVAAGPAAARRRGHEDAERAPGAEGWHHRACRGCARASRSRSATCWSSSVRRSGWARCDGAGRGRSDVLARWRTTRAKAVAGSPERREAFATTSEIPVADVYTPDDLAGLRPRPGPRASPASSRSRGASRRPCTGPGSGPCASTRGSRRPPRPTSASATCSAQGQTGLSVAFDLPTQMGYDSRRPGGGGRGGPGRRPDLLPRRHGGPVRGHPAGRGQHLDDHQRHGADPARPLRGGGRAAGRRPGRRSAAPPRTTSSRSTSPGGPGSTRPGRRCAS